jgi:hypothetical protein
MKLINKYLVEYIGNEYGCGWLVLSLNGNINIGKYNEEPIKYSTLEEAEKGIENFYNRDNLDVVVKTL